MSGSFRQQSRNPTAAQTLGDVQHEVRRPRVLEWTVSLYVASTIIESAVVLLGSARISFVVAGLLILVVIGYAASRPIPRIVNPPLIGIIGVFVMVAASFPWSEAPERTFSRILTFGGLAVTSAALAAALAYLGGRGRGIICIARGLVLGATIASLLVMYSRIRGNFTGPTEIALTLERSSAGAANPNDLALLLAVALPACLWSRHWTVRYLVSPLTIVAIFFTGSRGALIALAAGALAATLLVPLLYRHYARRHVQLLALAAGAVWVAWRFLPQPLVERFQNIPEELGGGSYSHRTTVWEAAWEQFGEHPFFGTGSGTARAFIDLRTGRELVAHNTHLSFLLELGIIGWLFFFLALSVAWMGVIRSVKTVAWPVVSLAILTIGIFSLSWEFNKLLWIMLIAGGALLVADKHDTPVERGYRRLKLQIDYSDS